MTTSTIAEKRNAASGKGSDSDPLIRFHRVLSAEAGPLHADEDLRQRVCLVTDYDARRGQLYLSQAHRTDLAVLSYEERVRRAGIVVEVVTSTLKDIAQFYGFAHGASGAGGVDSINQQKVLAMARDAVAQGASDVHFYIKRDICQIRFRIHGMLSTQDRYQYTPDEGMSLVRTMYNTMAMEGEQQLDPSRDQDAQLQYEYAEKAQLSGSRIATRPANERGLLVVLRLMLPDDGRAVTLETLGYLPEQLSQINYMTARTHGINIFTGVTGSGKSTSLKASIEQQARRANQQIHILTLESPTEYRLSGDGIVQTPVSEGGWARSIRSAMRLDPDIIMLGEIRDPESALTAFDAAQTGHGLWTTLHTNDAAGSLLRLRRLGVDEDFLFDPTLVTGLINQSLVPRLCQACALPLEGNETMIGAEILARLTTISPSGALRGVKMLGEGCSECRQLGIAGRTVVAEVITPTAAFMQTYRTQGKLAAQKLWIAEGGVTKLMHLMRLIHAGLVDPRHGERVVGPLTQDAVMGSDVESAP
ncbi:GspE/PulE family protein [Pinirhizobacter soli]|uniref:GspE/PulE family protein n=1 Tax=Pinirhizobacter soli TaxID=2786953 RepID=UPI00202A85E1|nr:ATPase, T2SS/T4P/T4SS family [Pinirhizobacter soli]